MDVFAKEKLEKKKLEKKKIGELFDGTIVYVVDGKYVRDHCGLEAIDFIYGGHGYVYSFIPKDEIWIEKMFHPHEQALWVVHETFEWLQMKYMKKPYEPSHEKADSVEHVVRLMLNSTAKLRIVLAAKKLYADPSKTQITNKMKAYIPQKRNPITHPVREMEGWLLKHINGDKTNSVITMLEHAETKVETDELIQTLGQKYDRTHINFPPEQLVDIPYKGKRAAISKPYFVTWDVNRGALDLYLLYRANSKFFMASIDRLRRVLQAKADEKAKKIPAKVTEIADAIRRDNPSFSDEKAFRMAWETFCSYVEPGYEGCTSKGKSHRESPKSDYSDESK